MDTTNRTAEDAFRRVQDARLGSFADATDDYMIELRARLYQWIAEIDTDMALRIKAAEKRADDDDYRDGSEFSNFDTGRERFGSD